MDSVQEQSGGTSWKPWAVVQVMSMIRTVAVQVIVKTSKENWDETSRPWWLDLWFWGWMAATSPVLSGWVSEEAARQRETSLATKFSFGPDEWEGQVLSSCWAPDWSLVLCPALSLRALCCGGPSCGAPHTSPWCFSSRLQLAVFSCPAVVLVTRPCLLLLTSCTP